MFLYGKSGQFGIPKYPYRNMPIPVPEAMRCSQQSSGWFSISHVNWFVYFSAYGDPTIQQT